MVVGNWLLVFGKTNQELKTNNSTNFTEMEMQRPRRAPAIERFVNEISANDIRVKVFGNVSEIENGLAVLEDETGKIKLDTAEKIEIGKKVFIFGRPVSTNEGLELQAEIVKDASALNEKLYKKVHLLLNKGGL